MPRLTHPVFALCPLLVLAACGGNSETDASADQATGITPTAVAEADPVAATPIAYDCLPAQRLTASYDDTGETSTATLTLDGKIYELFATPTADGVRYVSEEGRTPGKTLVWFSKGEEGVLYEGDAGATAGSETKLAECEPSDALG